MLDGGRIGMIIVQEGLLLMLLCPMLRLEVGTSLYTRVIPR